MDGEYARITPARIISLLILAAILLAVPASVIIIGQKTREQIRADIDCKNPQVPDPKDCVNGTWTLYEDTYGCYRFRCIPR